MNIIHWLLSLFGVLKRIKIHAKAEVDLALGRDSTPLLANDSDRIVDSATQDKLDIIERRKKRKAKHGR